MQAMKINTTHYKDRLEVEKKLLEEELATLGIFNPENQEWEAIPEDQITQEADENDVADRHEGYEERTAMLNTLESKLNEVLSALKKIENGTYGKCEICGEPIEEKRLEANAAARTCMKHINE
jgi:RNA polymerase-binding transcription factor DksA